MAPLLLARFAESKLVQLSLILARLFAASVMVAYAAILGCEAGRLWERLLRDPGVETRMLSLAGAALLAIGEAALIAALLGAW